MENPVTLREIPEDSLPPDIAATKDKNERILWIGEPDSAMAFALSSGCLRPAILGIAALIVFGIDGKAIGVLFGLLCLTPIPAYMCMAGNTRYAVSDRRVIIKTGFLNRNVSTIDYDGVGQVSMDASATERVFGVGTVTFDGAGTGPYRGFIAMKNASEIAALLKSVSVDVKTDWMYPNAKRPGENKGYRTTYCFAGEDKSPTHRP